MAGCALSGPLARVGPETTIREADHSVPVLSVVMPMYNVASFLPQTLRSICSQTLRDFEVIAVDDGSTDATRQIADGIAEIDSRFRCVHQAHQGAACARNRGMRLATGTYLMFLDGDDLFEPTMFERMVTGLEESGADFCQCRFRGFVSKTGDELPAASPLHGFKGVHEADAYLPWLFQAVSTPPWDKMFRREYVTSLGVEFQDLPVANDVRFVLLAAAFSSRALFLDDEFVRYRVGSGESLQDRRIENPTCPMLARKAVFDELAAKGVLDRCVDSFRYWFCRSLRVCAPTVLEPADAEAILDVYHEVEDSFDHPIPPRFGLRAQTVFRLLRWSFLRMSPQGLMWACARQYRGRTEPRVPLLRRASWFGRILLAGALRL